MNSLKSNMSCPIWIIHVLVFCCSPCLTANICYALRQRCLILKDHLYFMGGFYSLVGKEKLNTRTICLPLAIASGSMNHQMTFCIEAALFSLNLKSHFPVEGYLDSGFVGNRSASTAPYQASGVFWADLNQTLLYSMGTLFDDESPGQSTIEGYDIKNDDWLSISVTGGSFNHFDRYMSMWASSFDGGGSLSFVAGDKAAGIVIFDSSNPIRPSWENVTDGSTPYFSGAATQYVRFGDAGVIVSVCGFVSQSSSMNVAQRRETNSVLVYDIATREWFTIYTTGAAPPPRSRGCSALNAAPDDSSFQMILYGGWDEKNVLGDVWVLTMPAFHWIKVNTTSTKPLSVPRMDHSCATYQDRQMLVIGGKNKLEEPHIPCADNYSALRMLDTTTFQWQTHYPLQDTMYKVPQPVIDIIGGNSSGNARPASFFSKTLGQRTALFNKIVPRYNPDNPPKKTVETSLFVTPSATKAVNTSSSPSLSSGAIAGVVLSSVIGAALFGGTVWFFLISLIRRRQKAQRNISYKEQQQWQKPELPPTAQNGPLQIYGVYEVGGETSRNLDPSEIDTARERLEAPGDTAEYRHELGVR